MTVKLADCVSSITHFLNMREIVLRIWHPCGSRDHFWHYAWISAVIFRDLAFVVGACVFAVRAFSAVGILCGGRQPDCTVHAKQKNAVPYVQRSGSSYT